MGSLSNGEPCNGDSNKRHLEDGRCTASIILKYKKRKVSAVRDFPPGCGPNAPSINVKLVDDEKKMDASVDIFKASESGDELLSHEMVKSPVEMEMADLLDDLVGKVVASAEIVNGVDLSSPIQSLGDDFSQTLAINAPELSKEFHKVEVPAVIKSEDAMPNKTEVEICPRTDETAPPSDSVEIFPRTDEAAPPSDKKSSLMQQSPISDANIVKEPAMKNKYPGRRVSATRDFPPFCGRNAPCPTEEERLKIILEDKALCAPDNAVQQCGVLTDMARAKEEGSPMRETRTITEEIEGDIKDGNYKRQEFERIVPELETKTQSTAEQRGPSMEIVKVEVEGGPVSETRGSDVEELDGNVREGDSKERKLAVCVPDRKTKSQKIMPNDYKDDNGMKGEVSKEIVVYSNKSLKNSHSDDFAMGCEGDRVIVQGLMAAPNCPWRHDLSRTKKVENLKFVSRAKVNEDDYPGGKSLKKKSPSRNISGKNKGLVIKNEGDFDAQEQGEVSPAGPRHVEVTLPPFGPNSSSEGNVRNKVRETLRLFQAICRKLLQGEESSLRRQGKASKRIDLQAAHIIRTKGKEVNTSTQIIGAVPGIEVGDEFQYRVELALVGIHRLYQAGIDYIKNGGMIIATSIVASGGYADDLDNPDVLIYSGQGGITGGKDKQPEDQKLERGNLALKNSITSRNPVRVIRGTKETKTSNADSRGKAVPSYAYDGLYIVEKYWHEVGPHDKLVFKFELRRIPGQPELAWKEVKKSKKFKTREGICVDDISNGKELFPICAVNTIDNEKPPTFSYITEMIYPSWYCPTPPEGCGCVGGCSDSRKCACVVKNGEGIPYNHNGAIVEAKPLVFECGPSCKCPPSCYNRVSQHGIKIQLEIFKTESRGWGVRSLTSIPSGSFICEYIGEFLEDKQAEQRSNDEYLFDIGQNYSDCSHLDGLSTLNPDAQMSLTEVVEDSGFTIDAASYGNLARFINHSCSPNLYAQNVLYDHEDKRMPHIMLFAAENIPPLQELTYHYNYSVDQVHDSNGNIRMKSCYCGSEECTGRMY